MAMRWGQVGVGLGLLGWLLIGLMGSDSMTFMFWTWLWPVLLGVGGVLAGVGAAWGAWRQHSRPGRIWAAAALLVGTSALLGAVAGFVGMVGAMAHGPMVMP
ncbi:MAG: hypothetical protein M3Z04_20835 [Chloroflexota bacterium]|nr:hypothetical protein [Chloroflexota bacterium]